MRDLHLVLYCQYLGVEVVLRSLPGTVGDQIESQKGLISNDIAEARSRKLDVVSCVLCVVFVLSTLYVDAIPNVCCMFECCVLAGDGHGPAHGR